MNFCLFPEMPSAPPKKKKTKKKGKPTILILFHAYTYTLFLSPNAHGSPCTFGTCLISHWIYFKHDYVLYKENS